MDRRRPRVKYAFAAFVFIAGIAACGTVPPPDDRMSVKIATLDWLDAEADPVGHLTTQPASCLSKPDEPAVQRGALLFASPLLLGGQAAKAGLSCAACHRNGRDNPDFVFTGISGSPGTADVTHGLFSKLRADQVFNPVAIPDLVTQAGRTRVDRDTVGVLEAFLIAQIVEEFAGTTPERQTIADLSAFIRALDDRACDAGAFEDQTWQIEVDLLRAGLAGQGFMSGDYISAMRAAVGRLHNRYPARAHYQLRADLVALSRALTSDVALGVLQAKLELLATQLEAEVDQSLYNPRVLEKALR